MNRESNFENTITRPSIAIPGIVLVSGIIFFWALGEPAYWDRDEPRNAGCAAEMMARGNWIVPTFNDELRQQKPPLLYWLMGVAYWAFGVSEFSGRFFSALLAVGTVMATWGIARSFYDRATAMLASLMLASSLMFCVAARAATPDSVLIFCVTMALWIFARQYALAKKNPFDDQKSVIGIYIFLGLAILTKGPVGFVLPMAVMGWFLLQRDQIDDSGANTDSSLWRRNLACFSPSRFIRTLASMKPVWGTAIALLIAAPWFVAVGISTEGEFLKRFFIDENFGRATKVLESHSGGLWYYPLAILVGFFPWSTFWGPVAFDLAARTTEKSEAKTRLDDGSRFAICWIVVQVAAFSLVKTKLPSYVTPCYPALAILTAYSITRLVRNTTQCPGWLWKVANVAMIVTGLAISVALWLAAAEFKPIPAWLTVLGILPVAIGTLGWLQSGRDQHTRFNFAVSSSLLASVFCVGLLGAGAASVGKDNRMALTDVIQKQPSAKVAAYGCLESTWVYYGNRPIVELHVADLEDKNATQRLLNRKFWQKKPWLSPQQFVDSTANGLIITTDQKWPELKKRLPEDWKVIQTADWFLKDSKLLLIGTNQMFGTDQKQLKVAELPTSSRK
jgi:4-amino-4-deoxy-L-arabinose transferase-like glycosyltransferase